MNDFRRLPGFIDRNDVPRFNAATSIREVFQKLGEERQSGFIVYEGGRPSRYIDARVLVRLTERLATRHTPRQRRGFGRTVLKDILNLLPEYASIPIDFMPVSGDRLSEVVARDPESGFIVTEAGKHVGWYLRREWVSEARTRRVRFICVNGHINWDPDTNWTCYSCFFPVKRVEEERM